MPMPTFLFTRACGGGGEGGGWGYKPQSQRGRPIKPRGSILGCKGTVMEVAILGFDLTWV